MPHNQRRQDSDGTPHFTYFDYETQLSFIWDGLSECIQVCLGGYGEPIVDEIPTHIAALTIDTAVGWLAWFHSTCHAYIVIKKNV